MITAKRAKELTDEASASLQAEQRRRDEEECGRILACIREAAAKGRYEFGEWRHVTVGTKLMLESLGFKVEAAYTRYAPYEPYYIVSWRDAK